uniref:Secreted protein n=1 Tax=Cacopsylla melanoneura TaxID=428564 RepID=A0A8D8QAI9_9HEMI
MLTLVTRLLVIQIIVVDLALSNSDYLVSPRQRGIEAIDADACKDRGEAQGSRRTLLFHPRRTVRSARRYSRGPARLERRSPWRQTTGPRWHAVSARYRARAG